MVDPNFTSAAERLDDAGRATALDRLLGILRSSPGQSASPDDIAEKAYGGTPHVGPHDLKRAVTDALQLGLIDAVEGGYRLTERGAGLPDETGM